MQKIIDFLNANPCLSSEWKSQLLQLISGENNIVDNRTFHEKLKELLISHEGCVICVST